MCAKQLDFRVVAQNGGKAGIASVDGIPDELWMRFVKNANEIMPEKGSDAWAALLSEVIANVGGGGETHTLIMTDIPLDAVDGLDAVAKQVSETADSLIALLYRYASEDALHLVSIQNQSKEPVRALVMLGIPATSWAAWSDIARKAQQTPEGLFGLLMQVAGTGGITITANESKNE